MKNSIKKITLKSCIVYLEDLGEGRGKIMIDDYGTPYTHFWGSMGSKTVSEFITCINSSYFCGKLIPGSNYIFSGKQTAKNIRKYIREDLNYELPWYQCMGCHKALREAIKEIEASNSGEEAVYIMERIAENVKLSEHSETGRDADDFIETVENMFSCEPWHFLGEELSPTYKRMEKIHKELIEFLNKNR